MKSSKDSSNQRLEHPPLQWGETFLETIVRLWVQRISANLTTLRLTIGLVGWLVGAIVLWILHVLITQTFEQPMATFDRSLLLALHQIATPGLDRWMLGLTRLGNVIGVVPVGGVTLGLLLRQRADRETRLFAIGGIGAYLLSEGLKRWFARPRPTLWPTLIHEPTFSFPSSHALGLTVLYGLIAHFLGQRYPWYRPWIQGGTILLVGTVGLSRLYLGVHWPTDVLAGWSVGTLWLITCLILLRRPLSADH